MKQFVAIAAAAVVAVGFATAAVAGGGCGYFKSSTETASTAGESATDSQTAQAPRSEK